MKKLVIACGVVAMSVFATSCKKDYTCTCTITDSNGDVVSTASTTLADQKKKDAEDACSANESSAGGLTASCDLEEA